MEIWIEESRQRCFQQGLDPNKLPMPELKLTAKQLQDEKHKYTNILVVTNYFAEKILAFLSGTPHLIVVTNDTGYILDNYGDETMKHTISKLGIHEGIKCDEEFMGTNVVALALREQKPIQIIGKEHYHTMLAESACYCVPFHFANFHNLSGAISIMTSVEHHHPAYLALLANMVDSIERELSLHITNHNQNLVQQLVVNNMRNGIIMTDERGIITEFNAFAEKITGRNRTSVTGTPVFPFEHFGSYFYQALKYRKQSENIELTLRTSLDQENVCLFDVLPILNEQGELLGAFAQFRDITDRVVLERQVINSEKFSAIGKLAAGLAHEIRNPLTAIIGFFQLSSQSNEPQKLWSYKDLIDTELQSMKQLVSDFVLMAKPSSPDRKAIHIQEFLRDTIRFMDSQAILKNTAIRANIDNTLTVAMIDPTQIKQVLVNLLQNAIESIEKNGVIQLSAELDLANDRFKIMIEDNGGGMTKEELDQIVNPFFTTKENGVGLGLSICYRIIDNHQGTMTATSTKGYGTRFEVTLPLG
ncbi:ATP-binding protein [Paenibacillus aceris]|uniref:histidine kinase n=1 Tax=Paenibacillus aceris TaxID=869555 RepID=A0ABS4HW21_9BACL|nr:ATP-binding protein [Paenibacillus aceris]MBP1962830.1 PAS domain S-box-containing protein [Paenibacillus aceris]NHW38258.1 PAS domain-containing protein [Paenibacillus aceris]